MTNLNVTLNDEELQTAISALLFSCSVNVMSNTNSEFQTELFNLAVKLKNIKPDIKLPNVQFVQEDNFEDVTSSLILESFEDNIEIITFDSV